jgi:thiamine transport system substrate-binding protein
MRCAGTFTGALPLLFFFACISILGCRQEADRSRPTLTVMTHDSFKVSDGVVKGFERANGCTLAFLRAGDAGAALNQALLSRNNPLADVFYGVDNTFLGRALKADIFEPYRSAMLSDIPDELELDRGCRLLPVDYGDVCLNYDRKWFSDRSMAPPASLEDLIRPACKDLLVVENPATSSPGLAFLLVTIGRFGEDGYLEYWRRLKDNGVMVVSGWEDAYWGQFSAASRGTRPIVVSYATSPAAQVYFSGNPAGAPPTAAVTAPGTAFRQIEFVGVLRGSKHVDLARRFVDYMLDRPFQEDIPLNMFVFPANAKARLPEVFKRHAVRAEDPVTLDMDRILKGREAWIEAWTDTVLR